MTTIGEYIFTGMNINAQEFSPEIDISDVLPVNAQGFSLVSFYRKE